MYILFVDKKKKKIGTRVNTEKKTNIKKFNK